LFNNGCDATVRCAICTTFYCSGECANFKNAYSFFVLQVIGAAWTNLAKIIDTNTQQMSNTKQNNMAKYNGRWGDDENNESNELYHNNKVAMDVTDVLCAHTDYLKQIDVGLFLEEVQKVCLLTFVFVSVFIHRNTITT
jgi:hypothetical protein